jgi:hypothetical protein
MVGHHALVRRQLIEAIGVYLNHGVRSDLADQINARDRSFFLGRGGRKCGNKCHGK